MYQKLTGSGIPLAIQWNTAVSLSEASTDSGSTSQYGEAAMHTT